MNIGDIKGLEQLFLGMFLIAHGLIHLIFLIYKYDEESKVYTGWSGRSWLLDKVIPVKFTTYIGKIAWVLIMILFVLSGLSVLDLLVLNDYLAPLIIISSILAALSYIIFFDGLFPTPYHWILGLIIDMVLIVFVIFSPHDISLLLPILILIWLWGMFIHTKIIPKPSPA